MPIDISSHLLIQTYIHFNRLISKHIHVFTLKSTRQNKYELRPRTQFTISPLALKVNVTSFLVFYSKKHIN